MKIQFLMALALLSLQTRAFANQCSAESKVGEICYDSISRVADDYIVESPRLVLERHMALISKDGNYVQYGDVGNVICSKLGLGSSSEKATTATQEPAIIVILKGTYDNVNGRYTFGVKYIESRQAGAEVVSWVVCSANE